jgi:hypothetical protein
VDLRAGLDDLEKRKFLTVPGLELQPVASRYTDYTIPAQLHNMGLLNLYSCYVVVINIRLVSSAENFAHV